MIHPITNNITQPIKRIPVIEVHNEYLGKLSTYTYRDAFDPKYIVTELRNKMDKVFGREIFTLFESDKTAIGVLIKVEEEYQHRGWNLGELLRLSSVMAILENKIREFEIYSKETAIYFHSKYKFKPAIIQFKERDGVLSSIIQHCGDEFKEYGLKAADLLQEAKNCNSDEIQRELCVKTNNLANEYIKKVLQTKDGYKKHPFDRGMRMVLTDEEIQTNKNFFNDLYKKHNIDYTI